MLYNKGNLKLCYKNLLFKNKVKKNEIKNPFIFMPIFLVSSLIECQVVLNRAQLAEWYPSYATATYIYLSNRNIQSIEASTFSNLNILTRLYLSGNQLSSLKPSTLDSLMNLKELLLEKNVSIYSNRSINIF